MFTQSSDNHHTTGVLFSRAKKSQFSGNSKIYFTRNSILYDFHQWINRILCASDMKYISMDLYCQSTSRIYNTTLKNRAFYDLVKSEPLSQLHTSNSHTHLVSMWSHEMVQSQKTIPHCKHSILLNKIKHTITHINLIYY